MKINLINPSTNQIKRAKIGFSWTTFFFGFWPALFRGDWLWFLIMLIAEILLGLKTYGFGALIVLIIFAFVYNKLYINGLLSKGWQPADQYSNEALVSHGFIVANNNFNNQTANNDSSNDYQNMSRINRNKSSHIGATILAIVTAFVVIIIMFIAFGGTIANTFDEWTNPVGVTNKIKEKVNNPDTSQSNNGESTDTTGDDSSSDDSNNDTTTTPTTSEVNNNSDTSLNNAVDKIKNQVSSVTNKTDSNPSDSNSQSNTTDSNTSTTGNINSNN